MQRPRGVVHFLPVDCHTGLRFVGCFEQRAGAARWVVDRLRLARGGTDPDYLRHHARHLGRRVELAFAFA